MNLRRLLCAIFPHNLDGLGAVRRGYKTRVLR